ncbi:MAG: hypothetical protein Q9174_005249 [Haloplaca sp. 1 TL-2023]
MGKAPENLEEDYTSPESYYDTWESRIGYRFVNGGYRHFGFYDVGTYWPFPLESAMKRMENHLYESLNLPPGAKVLDVGCGVGQVALHMAHKGLRVEGIDITKNHVRWTQQRIKAEGMQDMVSAKWGDFHDLSGMADESFDGVYAVETLLHASDPSKVMGELYRVMKPGGHSVFHVYDHIDINKPPPGCPAHFMDDVTRVNERSGMPGLQMFARGVLKQVMEEQGFEDIEIRDLSENIRPNMRYFYLLAYIPYLIICFLGLSAYFVNTEGAVIGYQALRYGLWRFLVITARKPSTAAGASRRRAG